MEQPQRNPRIVVVGAGVAGIGAATKLKDLGFSDITLVEASENVGGRIGKANLGNTVIDTGAQYIHGASERNPLYCLFKKYDLLSQDLTEGKHIFYCSSGQNIDEKFAEEVYEAGERIVRFHGVNTGKSIGEHFAEKAADVLESYQGDEKKRVQSVLAMVGKDLLLDIGASNLHNVSLDSWQYYIDMGEDLNVPGLMFRMVDRLREDIPNECLLLNKAVSKIEWNGIFPGKDLMYPVRVVCKNGDEILADHVIVTLSLGG